MRNALRQKDRCLPTVASISSNPKKSLRQRLLRGRRGTRNPRPQPCESDHLVFYCPACGTEVHLEQGFRDRT